MPLDSKLQQIDLVVKTMTKIHKIANHIKANGMYSEKEIAIEQMNMNKLNTPDEEQQLLNEVWEIRQLVNKKIMKDFKDVLQDIKEFYATKQDGKEKDFVVEKEKTEEEINQEGYNQVREILKKKLIDGL